jgi:hypothetical protein
MKYPNASALTPSTAQTTNQSASSRKVVSRSGINPSGLMFLPDGKALIMDQELFKHTVKNSIVIDLVETQKNNTNELNVPDSPESNGGF